MSKFYSKFCERNNIAKPNWLISEEHKAEVHNQHINQAKLITTTKHVGSKNTHKLEYNAKHVGSRVKTVLSRYGLQ